MIFTPEQLARMRAATDRTNADMIDHMLSAIGQPPRLIQLRDHEILGSIISADIQSGR